MGRGQTPEISLARAQGLSQAAQGGEGRTWMVTMRGSGCRVFAPPSMAMPKVGALLDTRIRHDVGSRSPGCGDRWQHCQGVWTPCASCAPSARVPQQAGTLWLPPQRDRHSLQLTSKI